MPSIMDNFVQIVSYTKDVILLSDYGVKVFLKIHVGVIRFSVKMCIRDRCEAIGPSRIDFTGFSTSALARMPAPYVKITGSMSFRVEPAVGFAF